MGIKMAHSQKGQTERTGSIELCNPDTTPGARKRSSYTVSACSENSPACVASAVEVAGDSRLLTVVCFGTPIPSVNTHLILGHEVDTDSTLHVRSLST